MTQVRPVLTRRDLDVFIELPLRRDMRREVVGRISTSVCTQPTTHVSVTNMPSSKPGPGPARWVTGVRYAF